MKISKRGIILIEQLEGFSEYPYYDLGGVLTLGYGSVVDTEEERKWLNRKMTREVAEKFLMKDIAVFEQKVNALTKTVTLNQNQFDALISFTYNLGWGALQRSTLLKKLLKNPNNPTIKNEFEKWIYAGGKKVNGLVKRRKKESELYFQKP